jgi:para-nitrobenzyl esterase
LQSLAPEGFGPWTPEFVVQGAVSEDCLYLNVWAPTSDHDKAYPVLVWIHGGAFVQGSGSVPIYSGRALAEQGVVVVTINYRLGVMGFFQHPDLGSTPGEVASGNFGLMDQLAALQWVQDNIAALGGDPQAVTLAGQSAGAVSVHALVNSSHSAGLFHRAIAMSGPPSLGLFHSTADAQAQARALAAGTMHHGMAELRSAPAQHILTLASQQPWYGPIIDGTLVPIRPPGSLVGVSPQDVPMLMGQTADENSALDPHFASTDPGDLRQLLKSYFGDQDQRMADLYGLVDGDDAAPIYRSVCTDRWLLSLWAWATQRQQQCRSPIYVYHFEHVPSGPQSERYGSFHTSDVPYCFMTLDASAWRGLTSTDRAISSRTARQWLNFIKTGDPNETGSSDWPIFRHETPMMWSIGATSGPKPMFSAHRLQALTAYVAEGGRLSVLP